MADVENSVSNRILQKIGMIKLNEFNYENVPHNFYTINKENWQNQKKIKSVL